VVVNWQKNQRSSWYEFNTLDQQLHHSDHINKQQHTNDNWHLGSSFIKEFSISAAICNSKLKNNEVLIKTNNSSVKELATIFSQVKIHSKICQIKTHIKLGICTFI